MSNVHIFSDECTPVAKSSRRKNGSPMTIIQSPDTPRMHSPMPQSSPKRPQKTKLSREKFLRARALISDLLDLKHPKVSDPMVAFLRQDGVFAEVFLQFLKKDFPVENSSSQSSSSPITPNSKKASSTSQKSSSRVALSDKTNSASSQKLLAGEHSTMLSLAKNALHNHVKSLERAHKAMTLILESRECESFHQLVAQHFTELLRTLFDEYTHSDSCKLFHCVRELMQFREDWMLSTIQRENLLEPLFEHLQNEYIVSTIEAICRVTPRSRENLSKQDRKRLMAQQSPYSSNSEEISFSRDGFYGYLGRTNLLARLAELVAQYSSESDIARCENACRLFLNLAQDAFTRSMWSFADEITGNSELLTDLFVSAPMYTPALIKALNNRSATYTCRYSCSKILLFLIHMTVPSNFVLTRDPLEEDDPLQKHHIYFAILDQLTTHFDILVDVIQHYDDFSHNFDSVRTNGFTVQKPFTLLRMNLVHLWLSFTEYAAESTNAHQKLLNHVKQHSSPDVFGVLIDWFFEYRHNNLYHCVFKDIVLETCFFEEEELLQCMLSKHKLITRFIQSYVSEDCVDYRSHILGILNYLRLLSETKSPASFLRHFLNSHGVYKQFVPRLTEDTLRELNGGCGLCGRAPVDSIGLDSDFAESLGFSEDDAYEAKAHRKSSKEESDE